MPESKIGYNAAAMWGAITGTLSEQTDLNSALTGKIAKSLGTAKGDLIVYSGSGTPVKVAVGANDKVLKADSSETAGVKWADDSGGDTIPLGTVIPYAGTTAPSADWKIADGSAISRTTYSGYYAIAGTSFGSGDGSSTFNLPDLRGLFIRFHDDGAGNDPDAASRTANNSGGATGDNVGSEQADAFQAWQSGLTASGVDYYGYGVGEKYNSASTTTNKASIVYATGTQGTAGMITAFNDGTNGDPRTSSETRPKNLGFTPLIKVA